MLWVCSTGLEGRKENKELGGASRKAEREEKETIEREGEKGSDRPRRLWAERNRR
jgi:hypothetical protein